MADQHPTSNHLHAIRKMAMDALQMDGDPNEILSRIVRETDAALDALASTPTPSFVAPVIEKFVSMPGGQRLNPERVERRRAEAQQELVAGEHVQLASSLVDGLDFVIVPVGDGMKQLGLEDRTVVETAIGYPWSLRPEAYDDWGWVRTTDRTLLATFRSINHTDEAALDRHRSDGTDPYRKVAMAFLTSARLGFEMTFGTTQEKIDELAADTRQAFVDLAENAKPPT
jgi:hypothetical protein